MMGMLTLQVLAIILIVMGEALAIGAEVFAAYRVQQSHALGATFQGTIIPMLLGSALILAGYVVGYAAFKNVWVITIFSVGSIVIVEPLIIWYFFHEFPSKGALLGCVLAVMAITSALVWK